MHSRIFELKTDKTTENALLESSITVGDMNRYGIDYVEDMDQHETDESIEWLKNCYPDAIEIDMKNKTLRFTDPKKLMQSSFTEFQSVLQALSKMTIDDFVMSYPDDDPTKGISFNMWKLNNAYEDHSGFYIYTENGLQPINDFVRRFHGEITKQIFHIGNVLDYHC